MRDVRKLVEAALGLPEDGLKHQKEEISEITEAVLGDSSDEDEAPAVVSRRPAAASQRSIVDSSDEEPAPRPPVAKAPKRESSQPPRKGRPAQRPRVILDSSDEEQRPAQQCRPAKMANKLKGGAAGAAVRRKAATVVDSSDEEPRPAPSQSVPLLGQPDSSDEEALAAAAARRTRDARANFVDSSDEEAAQRTGHAAAIPPRKGLVSDGKRKRRPGVVMQRKQPPAVQDIRPPDSSDEDQ